MRMILLRAAFCLCAIVPTYATAATDYPTRPVRVIVGLTAGSGVDVLARLVGAKLTDAMGQPLVIENRPGAGSNIATRFAATQPNDGYTIFLATVANAINATLYKHLQFDVLRDFSPVILAGTAPNILLVHPSVPAKTVKEFIELAKAQPGKFTMGSSGTGTSPQMTGELFKRRAGIDTVHVPFKGGPEATTALLGGQIDSLFAITSTALPHIAAGKLRALGVTSRERTALLPQVPTVSESGLPGFEAVTWFGFTVPAGTPREIVDRLNGEIGKVLAMPEIRQQLARQGIDAGSGTPEQFGVYMHDEFAKWGALVKETGMSAD
ncbi:MAG: tripartite tricarboxylate transporter substrate binding protein [Rhizobiales bacterium]|nr:tripartite tricarboxylate transporter substrate binding protein [Hyphomicrobiales bacterium]